MVKWIVAVPCGRASYVRKHFYSKKYNVERLERLHRNIKVDIKARFQLILLVRWVTSDDG